MALAQADEWHFSDVERIVAVSDIHGAYDALIETLQVAEVIDEDLAWSGGKTHFVITGDLLDRGPDSRLVMDLIMRLENEAPRAGGRVHQLLGNHEVMNLNGDLRYVADEEYAAFLDIESEKDREYWYKRYRRGHPADSDEAAVRWQFDEKAPPGFFGHRKAFRYDGPYGKWLLQKPLMVVINDTVFVHGGIPPFVAEYGLEGVNVDLKENLHDYLTSRVALERKTILSPIDRFKEIPEILIRKSKIGQLLDIDRGTAQMVIDLGDTPLHGPEGPTWYRGTASCNSLIEGDSLNAALDVLGAQRVVIGHTPTITRRVQQRMNGRIVEIDTGMLKKNYDGSGHALIIDDGELSVVNQDGTQDLVPIVHPVRVGHESIEITDDELASILVNGEVKEIDAGLSSWKLVQVTTEDRQLHAYFRELPEEEGFINELAAYKLDRMLGLGMVPVTVRRNIADKDGTLQFVPAATLTERERVAVGRGRSTPCPLDRQTSAMFVFDTLIHNTARTPSTMVYSPDDWLLILVDHENAFGAELERPDYLDGVDIVIGDQWRAALLELDNATLRKGLGDVLDERRLSALASRRAALIKGSLE
ncbi:MAG: hypothetical protein GQ577_05275 [Woeseiaceae bacterium]|nr:hypothetical protein [Woeseiaceae bacterium]